jgi:uncharacterized protein YjbI with pentapeptide repeats
MNEKILLDNKDLAGSRFEMVNLEGVRFQNANLANANFNDVNLAGATLHDINFSDVTFSAAQFGGTVFKHLGLPPGSTEKQRGITFEEADMNDSVFRDVNLSNVAIEKCNTSGMTIDGILVSDLLEAWQLSKQEST